MPLTIWTNQQYQDAPARRLAAGVAPHAFVVSSHTSPGAMIDSRADAAAAGADVLLGQPDPADLVRAGRFRWVQIGSAGYTRYDRPELWAELKRRGVAVTNTSSVFADPCAQHLLAMMLGLNRRLPRYGQVQLGDRSWNYVGGRFDLEVLTGQTVLLLGGGAIGRRLTELLAPFRCRVIALRRSAQTTAAVETITADGLPAALAVADHVVDILPDNPSTRGFVTAERLARLKPGAFFYNIGRGTTVVQAALDEALRAGRLAGAYLDVTDPEPLPPEHPLWHAPNCHITPHLGGGHRAQDENLVTHFLENLRRFERGEDLLDRIL